MEVAQLESRMDAKDYTHLQSIFVGSPGIPRSLSRTEFIDLAWRSADRGSKQEYGLLFDSVLVTQKHSSLLHSRDEVKEEGHIDWGALCSFLLEETWRKLNRTGVISVPLWKPPRTLTCPHRDSVQKVLYLQGSDQYLTVSKGGKVVLWQEEDMSLLRTCLLKNSTVASRDLWVTDVVLLQNVKKIAVSFTCEEVCFYDIRSKQDFPCKYKLQGLRFAPWCLDYWVDPCDADQAVLTIGDTGGQVSALHFTSAQTSLFESRSLQSDSYSAKMVPWDQLVKGRHSCCRIETHKAHAPAWVRKVRYLASLRAFVSCCTRPQSSMVIGWRDEDGGKMRVTTYVTQRGVRDIDYLCERNLIATAGLDDQVLLWNPYVTSEPVCALAGHTNAVTAVRFMQTKDQLLSYSKDKVLCLWDVSSRLCVQRLAGVFPKVQEDTHTFLFLREERQHLLLSFNSRLLLLESTEEEKKRSISHGHTEFCAA
ncbi:WD repeat-containing protein 49 [Oryzias melastigma]|uniref:WD repeat-containing protein 49 n=1 Tax=Oryzias melastigma TaxID=30732 RepID=A0A834BWL4_ORYME|nr:WD repeat-containing protein 49 [Oryzias melastigma]